MALKLKKGSSWLLLSLFIIAGVVVQQGVVFGVTAPDKSAVIDLQAVDIASSGFMADENLITVTNTLLRPYTNDASADYYGTADERSAITNNNWCERTNDSADPGKDDVSNSELSGLWVTMDSNYLYVAIQGQAKGDHNNLMAMIDSSSNYGADNFNLVTHNNAWKRDILFEENFNPNVYLGFWCKAGTSQYNDTDDGGNSKLFYGDGFGTDWTEVADSVKSTNQDSHEGSYYTWYNGSTQTAPEKRLWMFKIKWDIITNTQFNIDAANLSIKLTVASTGPYDLAFMYDYMPETQYQIKQGAKSTLQNNYFIIPVTDASGNILTGGLEMNTNVSLNFYPGTRWDIPNSSVPIYMYDAVGNSVRAFSPNGDGVNDEVIFSVHLDSRKITECDLKIYDLKGRLVRTVFSTVDFDVDWTGTGEQIYNPPGGAGAYTGPHNVADSALLKWDGKNDSGNIMPMGFYVAVLHGMDGFVQFYSKNAFSLIR